MNVLRLALDQNFPLDLVDALKDHQPGGVELEGVGRIDPRLSDMDDRPLLIALSQMGWHGIATNNYKMLDVPAELAAIMATKCVFIAMRDMGNNPLRATGALLLELPGLPRRLVSQKHHIFDISYAHRRGGDPWEYMKKIANHQGTTARELYATVKVSRAEMGTPVLS
jgi:hypothetical protein